jgi:hypothetical protein
LNSLTVAAVPPVPSGESNGDVGRTHHRTPPPAVARRKRPHLRAHPHPCQAAEGVRRIAISI